MKHYEIHPEICEECNQLLDDENQARDNKGKKIEGLCHYCCVNIN